ncbi:MAG: hypothetical protein C0490_19005, partial [Marivirga sp.]|nr:hypothetical protein [Marivirga sp.]
RQKDNKYDGWVTEFVANLRKELEATFKEDVSIYFDENPHDGLLETHNVGKSLEGKLKSLILIPIISQTYCDPKSFAWQHEFMAFNQIASSDKFGRTVRLANGNMAERILPVKIHDVDPEDTQLYESATHEVLRSVDFIYRLPGVNRQLRARDDEQIKNPNQILYRDQVNKVAHAIKDLITGLKKLERNDLSQPEIKKIPSTPNPIVTETKTNKKIKSEINVRHKRLVLWTLPVAGLCIAAFLFVPKWRDRKRAETELLPEIKKLVDENFRPPTRAYDLALEVEKIIPGDSALKTLLPVVTTTTSIITDPPGAEVFWKDYDKPESPWRSAGVTPIKGGRFPRPYLRMEIRKEGYQTIEYAGPWHYGRLGPEIDTLKLDPSGSLPENMVRVPTKVVPMYIVGLAQHGGKKVHEFLMDRVEVSNKQFKAFMDAGGYTNKTYWQYPFYLDGKEIPFETAVKLFTDKTERQAPANWEGGMYPDGQEAHPVTGVSWYEAAAYASFVEKKLPTIFHWGAVAETSRTEFIIPWSNFSGKSSVPVGSLSGYSTFGIYDLAGNAREWCFNESSEGGAGLRFILGGGYNDATYSFNDSYTQPAFDRWITNG